MRVDDVERELGVSRFYAYKLIQRLNAELRKQGYITISGRVSRGVHTARGGKCHAGYAAAGAVQRPEHQVSRPGLQIRRVSA